MLCCDWFKYTTIPQSFATAKNRSSSPTKVRHIGWQLADAREYLLTSVASTVSRRIYIYIRDPHCVTIWYQIWHDDHLWEGKMYDLGVSRNLLEQIPWGLLFQMQ